METYFRISRVESPDGVFTQCAQGGWSGLIKELVGHPQAGSNIPIKNRSKETTPKSFPQKEEDTVLSEVADT